MDAIATTLTLTTCDFADISVLVAFPTCRPYRKLLVHCCSTAISQWRHVVPGSKHLGSLCINTTRYWYESCMGLSHRARFVC